MLTAILTTAVAVAGYLVGRARLGSRLLDWAQDADQRGLKSPRAWLAQPILAVALAWVWTVHPRRTLANVRSWREPTPRSPAVRIPTTTEEA